MKKGTRVVINDCYPLLEDPTESNSGLIGHKGTVRDQEVDDGFIGVDLDKPYPEKLIEEMLIWGEVPYLLFFEEELTEEPDTSKLD